MSSFYHQQVVHIPGADVEGQVTTLMDSPFRAWLRMFYTGVLSSFGNGFIAMRDKDRV